MQTTDETINMRAMFAPDAQTNNLAQPISGNNERDDLPSRGLTAQAAESRIEFPETVDTSSHRLPQVVTEAQALKELPAVPLYFASSYALVKPYVQGFDANLLDAPSLKRVRIDSSWQTPQRKPAQSIWFKASD